MYCCRSCSLPWQYQKYLQKRQQALLQLHLPDALESGRLPYFHVCNREMCHGQTQRPVHSVLLGFRPAQQRDRRNWIAAAKLPHRSCVPGYSEKSSADADHQLVALLGRLHLSGSEFCEFGLLLCCQIRFENTNPEIRYGVAVEPYRARVFTAAGVLLPAEAEQFVHIPRDNPALSVLVLSRRGRPLWIDDEAIRLVLDFLGLFTSLDHPTQLDAPLCTFSSHWEAIRSPVLQRFAHRSISGDEPATWWLWR